MPEDQGPEAPVTEERVTPDMILLRAGVYEIPFTKLHEHGFYLRLGDEEVAGRVRAAHFNRQSLLEGGLWLELSCRSLAGCRVICVEYVEDHEREEGPRTFWQVRLSNVEGSGSQELDEFQVT